MNKPMNALIQVMFASLALPASVACEAADGVTIAKPTPSAPRILRLLQRQGYTVSSTGDNTIVLEPEACVRTDDPTNRTKNKNYREKKNAEGLGSWPLAVTSPASTLPIALHQGSLLKRHRRPVFGR